MIGDDKINLKIFLVVFIVLIGGAFLLNSCLSDPHGCKRTKKVSRNTIQHAVAPHEIIYYADVLNLKRTVKERALTVTYLGVKENKLLFHLDFDDLIGNFDLGKRGVIKEVPVNGDGTADLLVDGFIFGVWGYCNLDGCTDDICLEDNYVLKVRLLGDGTSVSVAGLNLAQKNLKK